MTTTPAGAVSGLISGIDYRSLIDQIITNESQPAVTLRSREQTYKDQVTAFGQYKTLLSALQASVKDLRTGAAFDAVSASVAAVSGTRALITASGNANSATGTYQIQVTKLAKAQKLGSTTYASPTSALGLTAGSFTVNGATVNVEASDTLTTLRDKLNAVNTGAAASKVSASILQVDATHYRLVLTSDATGATGMTFANVSGGAPQALGLTDGSNVIQAGAVLVAGGDATFSVDGVPLTRSSNTVTDAISGVTLNLVAQEDGAVTNLTIDHSSDAAKASMQGFVDAWNKLVDYVKTQQTPPASGKAAPTLFADQILKTVSSTLSRQLLSNIGGTPADLSTAAMAGVSVGSDGRLTLDTTKFDTAFKTRLDDLRTLFSQRGSATSSQVSYVSSGSKTAAGTFAVNITQAATQAKVLGTGFGGTYADDGTPDTMTVTDLSTGATATISLSNGMTAADIASALSSAFAAAAKQKVAASATLYGDVGGTIPMTASTTLASLRLAGGASPGIAAQDSISFTGTRPDGSTFSDSFKITSPGTQTVGDLVRQIQNDYGTSASVSVVNGQIVVEDSVNRASSLGLSLTANNEGGGTLAFGASSVTVAGRPAMALAATNAGGQLQINATEYGSGPGFTVAYTAGGADGTAQLGVAAGSVHGLDVQGTIGGNVATGTGRTLVGGTGTSVEGLTLSYTGSTTGDMGSTTVTLGMGAQMQRSLDSWLEANVGTLALKTTSLNKQSAALEDRALQIDARMDRRRESLLKQYAAMETAIAKLQNSSSSITAMLNANKSNS
jgi:flagellar hook-associated protein 2